jgi:hypothetical protein
VHVFASAEGIFVNPSAEAVFVAHLAYGPVAGHPVGADPGVGDEMVHWAGASLVGQVDDPAVNGLVGSL